MSIIILYYIILYYIILYYIILYYIILYHIIEHLLVLFYILASFFSCVIHDVKAFEYNIDLYAEVSIHTVAFQLHNKMYCIVQIGGSSQQ